MARPRVLLADDHEAILNRVSQRLGDEFDIVATARDGQTALETALRLKPDVVVFDISMPRMTGLEAARQLSAVPGAPRIVFLTVHEDRDFVEAASRAGASGYVLKRNMSADLAAALRHALHE